MSKLPRSYDESSVFTAENLLREARRQKEIPLGTIPEICVLDPDGDIMRYLVSEGRAARSPFWACYHTDLLIFTQAGIEFGIVGCAVGASFAVLIAEEMFASGCKLLVSITSAGQLIALRPPPYFLLIEKALRDEGTSTNYLPPSEYSDVDPNILNWLAPALTASPIPIEHGASWTTDAPFRETQAAIDAARALGLHAVEMEAAALYAFAHARDKSVICFAHVTNQMASIQGDFEKGAANGSEDALTLLGTVGRAWGQRIKKMKRR